MKNLFLLFCIFLFANCQSTHSPSAQNVVTTDIDHFWNAYDQIVSTKDSVKQFNYLKTLFLEKGSPGLKAMMTAIRYTPQEYLEVIKDRPLFWESIRANTYKAKALGGEIESGVQKLRKLYPKLKPAKIYFTIGAFRSGGTTMDSLVLIGSEIAMADEKVITTELPEHSSHLPSYFATNPIKEIVFLNVHEFVHTQQKNAPEGNLLTQCLREGVAEFITVKSLNKPSVSPAVSYGKAHSAKVKEQFSEEMFNRYYRSWLWSNLENEFKVRDLGYYIGYAIAEKHYEATEDKRMAIEKLIDLNYQNDTQIEQFVEKTGYFSESMRDLREKYEKDRPKVVAISGFENGSQNVNPSLSQITIEFSTRMDDRFRGFDFGPLGESNVLSIKKFQGFSDDGRFVTFDIELQPNQQYQLVLSNSFSAVTGQELAPYLIDIKTRAK